MKASTALVRRQAMEPALYRVKVETFWRTIGVAPSGQQVLQAGPTIPPPGPVAPASGAPPGTLANQLESLARLHDEGVLSDDEFAAAKARLLGT
jgi:hypothetical protein